MNDPTLSDADYRTRARFLLAASVPGGRRLGQTRAAQVRERPTNDRRRIRALLKSLIPLRLDGAASDRVIAALGELEESYRDDCVSPYYGATAPTGHACNALVGSDDRQAAFRAFEAATLWAVRRGLRNG